MTQPLTTPPITARVHPWDERFHELVSKDVKGTITPGEDRELGKMMREKEATASRFDRPGYFTREF